MVTNGHNGYAYCIRFICCWQPGGLTSGYNGHHSELTGR